MSKLEEEARRLARRNSDARQATIDLERINREATEMAERNRRTLLLSTAEEGRQSLLSLYQRTGLHEKLIIAGRAFASDLIGTKFHIQFYK